MRQGPSGRGPADLFNTGGYGGCAGEQQQPGQGRRYIGCEGHMQNAGTSAPVNGRHGQGRKFIEAEDHYGAEAVASEPGFVDSHLWGPRGPVARMPVSRVQDTKGFLTSGRHQEEPAPTSTEMKDSIQEWLADVFGVVVYDQRKWADVCAQGNGSLWALVTVNSQGRTLAREGATAKAVSEKLSTMQLADLRHFGLRFAVPADKDSSRPGTGHNPTLSSPGVHHTFGSQAALISGQRREGSGVPYPSETQWGVTQTDADGPGMSCVRKDPEDQHLRYIATGKDNFHGLGQATVQDSGLPQRRTLTQRDHLCGGQRLDAEPEQSPVIAQRRAGRTGNNSRPLW
ncbi:unnamed protein product [Polarella glacialis]|uniref:Uncharacterized protein n=1 Tax=Polarella glacialis TaxID=89957 RepID=A0A813E731_POLGL|nr:unnamed protein product [Polarella glacialis]|mmetsp:Transcript_5436/g.10205  ORF Transcript_5436/g.10205 Transcript_5436/m.10205 type:complete len:342 (-) Transcript_5436:80-1105(-)